MVTTRGDSPVLKHFWILRCYLASRFKKHEIYTYLSINLCITYICQFCADFKMGRAKSTIIVEPSIAYHLKKKKSYKNIQWETKDHEHEISISTTHLVKHSICKKKSRR